MQTLGCGRSGAHFQQDRTRGQLAPINASPGSPSIALPNSYFLWPIQSQLLTILEKVQLDQARTLLVIMVDLGKPRPSSVPSAVAERRPLLRTLMDPKSIALIGATEAPNSVGRTFMENLISSDRTVYPVNPKRSSVLGVKAFPKISDLVITLP